MALTDSLRRQIHAATLLSERLRDLVAHYRGGCDAYRVTLQAARLQGLIRLHLAEQDSTLFPLLIASGRSELVRLTHEMKGKGRILAEAVEAFMVRWSSSALIGSDFAAFRLDLMQLLGQIDAHCLREDNLLYPLADELTTDDRRAA